MTHELRPALLTPTHAHVTRLAAVGLGFGLLGAALMAALAPGAAAPMPVPVPAIASLEPLTIAISVPVVVTVEAPPAPAVASGEVGLVFVVGVTSYLKLADLGDDGEPMPRHGRPRLTDDDYAYASTAVVPDAEVPRAYRGWKGKQVTVDGTCTTTVTGFAVVGRLSGDTGYAGEGAERWTAASVLAHGTPVLAARLAGCTGTYGRDAALPPVVVLSSIADASLAAAARQALVQTQAVRTAQVEWAEGGYPGLWHADPSTTDTTQVLRHPTTGQVFVSIQLHRVGGCGDPDLNVWGLYRADAGGALVDLSASLGEITTIEQLIDVEGDGQLEVLGQSWRGTGTILARATGEVVAKLDQQFYGCGC